MWLTNPDGTPYFVSDPLPEPTDEYNAAQLVKSYWTGTEIKPHPSWRYDNTALVDDDYLFYNEHWLLVTDTPPVVNTRTQVAERNPPEQWTQNHRDIAVTYTIRDKTPEEIAADTAAEWANVRRIRNQKLADLDRYVIIAYENGWQMSQAFRDYRTALRDIPETFPDPYSVVWPEEIDYQYYFA